MTEYIHLGDGIIVVEDALKVAFLMQYVNLGKNGDVCLELTN